MKMTLSEWILLWNIAKNNDSENKININNFFNIFSEMIKRALKNFEEKHMFKEQANKDRHEFVRLILHQLSIREEPLTVLRRYLRYSQTTTLVGVHGCRRRCKTFFWINRGYVRAENQGSTKSRIFYNGRQKWEDQKLRQYNHSLFASPGNVKSRTSRIT